MNDQVTINLSYLIRIYLLRKNIFIFILFNGNTLLTKFSVLVVKGFHQKLLLDNWDVYNSKASGSVKHNITAAAGISVFIDLNA